MLLQRVVYELFEFEVEVGISRHAAGDVELYRQVRLEGADGVRWYISWAWGHGQPDYFLDFGVESFFTAPPEAELDVSSSPLWQPLIGRTVAMAYRDKSWQVIEVRSRDTVVFCCSFQSDRVFVRKNPRYRR
jgi:hypothetical protein